MKKMSKNAQIGVVVLGLVVYAAAGWFLLVSRQSGKIAELSEQVAQVETKITETRLANQRAAAAPKEEPVKIADLFRLTKAMPDQTDMSGMLIELNRIARETGIEFASIVPGGAMPDAGFQIVPVDLVFQGDFYDLADFLYRTRTLVGVRDGALDARGRLFNVDRIEFTEGEKRFPNIRASLRLEAYVYGTGLPATTAPVVPTTPAAGATGAEGATPAPTEPPAAPEGATAVGATP
jgi:Tfp pilus assembly protein PilO